MDDFTALRSTIDGTVTAPGEDGFDDARLPWNRAVGQPAAAVVDAAGPADVAAVVRYARDHGLSVATQPSGHGASGATEGAVLLRTGRLDELSIDGGARTARVGAGVNWGRLQQAASSHGLTGLAGSSPVVSVTGYTLGGGLSWFGRRHGWASDSVTAFDVVGADGGPARVTAASDPDLFWALRGGGGDFVVVTAVEFALHPAPALFGGQMAWPIDRAGEVFAAFREITASAPEELTVWFAVIQPPGGDALVNIEAAFLGGEEAGRSLLTPLKRAGAPLLDTFGALTPAALGTIADEPTDPAPAMGASLLFDELDSAVEQLVTGAPAPLLAMQIRHLGGALSRPSDSPLGPLEEDYLLSQLGIPFTPDAADALRSRFDGNAAVLAHLTRGRTPFTNLNPAQNASDAIAPAALDRLRAIKRSRDPHGVVRSNYPVLA